MNPEEAKKKLEQEPSGAEIAQEIFVESSRVEVAPETQENVEAKIKELKGKIENEPRVENSFGGVTEMTTEERHKKTNKYQDKYLPDYLRKKGVSFISRAVTFLATRGDKFEKEGKENIPGRGPFIVICNHWGGASGVEDSAALLATFKDNNLHLSAGKEIWWDRSPIARWFFKKMGVIPVEESLSNLSPEDKLEALNRQGSYGRKVFKKIIDREEKGEQTANTNFVRQAVALLSRGDTVGVYPEGLWLDPQGPSKLREKSELKQGYRGIELIAGVYEKLTGVELPIVPVAFVEDKVTGKARVRIGQPLILSENNSDKNDTDWCMSHIAEMLPEEQRGYYKDK